MADTRLWDIVNELKGPGYKWVNLTHELSPETPHWFGFAPMQGDLLFDYLEGTPDDKMAPMRCHQWSVASQYGTHADVPIHFHGDGRRIRFAAAPGRRRRGLGGGGGHQRFRGNACSGGYRKAGCLHYDQHRRLPP